MEIRGEKITYTLDSPEIKSLCAADKRLAALILRYGGLNYFLYTDVFTFFVKTIIGQMLSTKAADAITARLYSLCNGVLTTEALLGLDRSVLKGIGLSRQKVEYILGFAETLSDHPDIFACMDSASDKEIIEQLTSLRGIGAWSAKMFLIFVLNRLDVLPYEDGAFIRSYKWLYGTDDVRHSSIKHKCAPWTPFASLAARYLYKAIDEGLTQDSALGAKLMNMGRC